MYPNHESTELNASVRDVKKLKTVLICIHEALIKYLPENAYVNFDRNVLTLLIIAYWNDAARKINKERPESIGVSLRFVIEKVNRCSLYIRWIVYSEDKPFMHSDKEDILTSWVLFN